MEVAGWGRGLYLLLQGLRTKRKEKTNLHVLAEIIFSKIVMLRSNLLLKGGHPHQKMRFPAAPVVGKNFLTPGHPGVMGQGCPREIRIKKFMFMLVFFPELLPATLHTTVSAEILLTLKTLTSLN